LFTQERVSKKVVDGGGQRVRGADVIWEESGSPDFSN
jgi:hypothetical protein